MYLCRRFRQPVNPRALISWLSHATALRADALGLGHVLGEIAVGKAADFLVVDLAVPELVPSYGLS
ncbi:amidohydrolase family protein [Streptomyces olivaceoviridis]|uniref:amidohydrolase family protein n=1 Tax=Streptomyces olivaceoviridis TaxID=1921 RepID=UPI0036BDBBE6